MIMESFVEMAWLRQESLSLMIYKESSITEKQREKDKKEKEQNIQEMWDN